jgi:hypothetical protein
MGQNRDVLETWVVSRPFQQGRGLRKNMNGELSTFRETSFGLETP